MLTFFLYSNSNAFNFSIVVIAYLTIRHWRQQLSFQLTNCHLSTVFHEAGNNGVHCRNESVTTNFWYIIYMYIFPPHLMFHSSVSGWLLDEDVKLIHSCPKNIIQTWLEAVLFAVDVNTRLNIHVESAKVVCVCVCVHARWVSARTEVDGAL